MVYFMLVGVPVVKIENLNLLCPETFCPKAKLTVDLDFTFPGQEDGHTPKDRDMDLTEIVLAPIKEAIYQAFKKLNGAPA